MRAYHSEVLRGQVWGGVITLAALVTGGYVAMHGHELAGAIMGGGGIGGIVVTFIVGRHTKPAPTATEVPVANITKSKRRNKK